MRPCIVLDIETVPDRRVLDNEEFVLELRAECAAPTNYKDPLKIAAYESEAFAREKGKLALNGWSAQIVAIGTMVLGGGDAPCVLVSLDDEALLLNSFAVAMHSIGAHVIGGFNTRKWDVPMLSERAGVHRVPLPGWWPTDGRAWCSHADLRDVLMDGRLDLHLMAHGLPRKTADGSQVATMTADQIRDYCAHDVRVTHDLLQIHAQRFEALRDHNDWRPKQ